MDHYVKRWIAQLLAIILFIAGFILGVLVTGNCQVTSIEPHKFFVEGKYKNISKKVELEFGCDAVVYYDSSTPVSGAYVVFRNTVLHREALEKLNKLFNHEENIDTINSDLFFRLREREFPTDTSDYRIFYN